jgi:hypothetical protein
MVNQKPVISYISFAVALLQLFIGNNEVTNRHHRKNKNKDNSYSSEGYTK